MLEDYKKIIKNLVIEFTKRYYTYDDGSVEEYDIISFDDSHLSPGPICIQDDYRSIDDIYVALNNNLDKEKVIEWYDYRLTKHMIKESPINLYNFCKGQYEYTEEEKKKDSEAIKLIHNKLESSIENTLDKVETIKIKTDGIKIEYSGDGKTFNLILK